MNPFQHYLSTLQPVKSGDLRFSFQDPDKVWFVRSGQVDLFYFTRNEEGQSRLNHFTRAGSGDLILGMPKDSELGLLAVGVVGVDMVETSLGQLRSQLETPQFGTPLYEAVDGWISKLVQMDIPKQHLRVEPGPDQSVEENTALLAKEGVAWVSYGKDAIYGDQLPVDGAAIPLTSASFLRVVKETSFSVHGTEGWLSQNADWSDLQAFHRLVIKWLKHRLEQEHLWEQDRIERKIQNDRLLIDEAVHEFADLFGKKKQGTSGAVHSDRLFAAANLVAEATGVTLNEDALKEANNSRDPLGVLTYASNIRKRQVILTHEWWRSDSGPLLGYTPEKQPVALLPKGPRAYVMVDPTTQETVHITAENQDLLAPTAVMFYRPLPNHALNFRDLAVYSGRGVGRELGVVAATGFLGGLIATITPYATGVIFDQVIPKAAIGDLGFLAMGLISVSLASLLFSLTRGFAILRFEGRVDAGLQAAIWDRIVSLPVPFFRDYTAGDLMTRAMSIDAMRRMVSGTVITSMLAGIFSIFYFFQLFYYSWRLALAGAGLILLALFPMVLGLMKLKLERKVQKLEGEVLGLVLQLIQGIAKLRVSGAEDRAFARWARLFKDMKTLSYKGGLIDAVVASWNSAYSILSLIGIFAFMMYLRTDPENTVTLGRFLAFSTAFSLFLAALLEMSDTLIQILFLVPVYERAKPILEARPEIEASCAQPGALSGAFEVNNLSFRYDPDGLRVLESVSFSVKPGEFVAVVGPSGSGKSTLFRMLLGFEKPEAGGVYYDGQELSGLDIRAVRRQIGVVLQNGKLMPGSIFENIVGSLPLSQDDAWRAAKMAGLDRDIKDMPMGMHTMISDTGGSLSGGQTQRLLIARALANKPRILFFDEATSALDNQTQAIVTQSLDQLRITRVVIAHRLSTIISADRIFVVDRGRLVESGSYESLIAQGGVFAELAKRQIA